MLNKAKARFLIGVGGLIAVSFMVMIGYTIGSQSISKQTEYQIRAEAKKLVTNEKEKERKTVLSDELVKEFLTQYYTKVQLGENNTRIKPYMTESAFSEEEANQNKAINQVYKDYMLDYRFESASIYVNTESNVALSEVTYQVTYVSDLSEQQQRTTQTETKTVILSYSKVSDKLLVNQLTIWNGKLEEMKEATDGANSSIPTIQGTTTSENN
ncbi:TPA: peptidylprolyl isomerase [Streptococcus agalactiae]|uniref:peptidylprolyl isomerase n=1 Tax=Streptococcus agalactiae TaxID=1311 RepID=UPI000E76814C|nr:peptidylprolyl isomerase [Streptococcus agalactiae]RJX43076.1 peptidylprolyl isomerase [Streptococcus agalactiae]HEM9977131.1 peptidylprolyl isomerase [Streptococcus agalactiae]HEM9978853.1 peptidylprolyl isomerase [Streptococcus agalactiae]HEM9983621.1 peptidylprolyl isomerase [Streptococcus agalactiae]HEM9985035.1 peptidylprolyl isomerase [Streptococcus agalactiae]